MELDELIDGGYLNREEAYGLTQEQIENLLNSQIQDLIKADKLAVHEAKNLTPEQRNNLCNWWINSLIEAGKLTVHEAKNLTPEQRNNLCRWKVNYLVKKERLDPHVAINLTKNEMEIIEKLYRPLDDGHINFEEVRGLDSQQKRNLFELKIQELIRIKVLTVELAKKMSDEQIGYMLKMFELLERKRVTPETILAIKSPFVLDFLINKLFHSIKAGGLKVHEAIELAEKRTAGAQIAEKLYKKYHEKIRGRKLQLVIQELKSKIIMRPSGTMNDAAKVCVERINKESCRKLFSDLNNKVLLALVYLASIDKDMLKISPENAGNFLVKTLYEIERAGNLDKDGRDDDEPSKPLLPVKVFDKLASAFQEDQHPLFTATPSTTIVRSLRKPEHRKMAKEEVTPRAGLHGGGGSGGGI